MLSKTVTRESGKGGICEALCVGRETSEHRDKAFLPLQQTIRKTGSSLEACDETATASDIHFVSSTQ